MHQTAVPTRRYDAAIQFLLSRIDYERATLPAHARADFSLDRMRRLMDRLGNPHQRLPMVHVAGTKGKGSTAAMMAGVLTAAGYRTGLYTSPHLERLEERIAVDGSSCSPEQLVALVERVRPAVEEIDAMDAVDAIDAIHRPPAPLPPPPGPTYFEITTAMALCHFAAQSVDVAVIEVGMGGRLDSTNIIRPRVSVITSISFDHMQQLGATLAAIAREKAGIIKPGVPVVSGVRDEEAREAIEEIRRRHGSPLVQLGRDFGFDYRPPRDLDRSAALGEMDFWTRPDNPNAGVDSNTVAETDRPESPAGYENLKLALIGRHQAANAAVALAALAELRRQGWRIPEPAVRRGLAEIRWPARVEVVGRRPTVVLDAAHNRASIASLLQTLDESFSARKRLLIFATTQEKQVRQMLELLLPKFDRVLLTRYTNNPRGVPLAELERLAGEIGTGDWEACPTPADAWRRAQELATPEHLLCVTGSFFLAAELRGVIIEPACAHGAAAAG